jgi:hypothetical protein
MGNFIISTGSRLLGYNALYSVENQSAFLSILSLLHLLILNVIFFEPESGGEMSSETSVDFQNNTEHYISEGRALHNRSQEDLKFCNHNLYFAPDIITTKKTKNNYKCVVRSMHVEMGSEHKLLVGKAKRKGPFLKARLR